MRRLLAVAATAAALAAVPTAAHAARTCGGAVDYQCTGTVCPTDCWQRSCLVWIDPLHNPNTAQCVGKTIV